MEELKLKKITNNGIENIEEQIVVEKTDTITEINKTWIEPVGVCGLKRNLKADKVINDLTWVKSKDKFYRFLGLEATNLKFSMDEVEWYDIEEKDSVVVKKVNNKVLTVYSLLEKEFKTEQEYLEDIKNPSEINYETIFCEI